MAITATKRIKEVLVEHNKTSKCLAGKPDMNKSTISNWGTNYIQPRFNTLSEIAKLLNVEIRDLLSSTKKNN